MFGITLRSLQIDAVLPFLYLMGLATKTRYGNQCQPSRKRVALTK